MRHWFLVGPFLLTSCASHTWAPASGMTSADFEPAKARCAIMARSGGSGFEASGRPAFVAAVALGAAIGNAIKANRDFNDCMVASGFQIADMTDAQRDQLAATHLELKTKMDEMKSCIANVRADEKFTPIATHFPDVVTDDYTMEQLADTTVPNNEEAHLAAEYYDQTKACRHEPIARMEQLMPASTAALEENAAETEAATKRLVDHQMTWGDFIQSSQDRQKQLKARLQAAHV